jgi:hypothetical protein
MKNAGGSPDFAIAYAGCVEEPVKPAKPPKPLWRAGVVVGIMILLVLGIGVGAAYVACGQVKKLRDGVTE